MPTLIEAARELWFTPEALLHILRETPKAIEHRFTSKIYEFLGDDRYDHPECIEISDREIRLILHGAHCFLCGVRFAKIGLVYSSGGGHSGWYDPCYICKPCHAELSVCEWCDDVILPETEAEEDSAYHQECYFAKEIEDEKE